MKKLMMIAVAAGLVLAGSVQAADAEKAKALAQSKNCLACHAIDKKLVGPAYTENFQEVQGQQGCWSNAGKESDQWRRRRVGNHSNAAQSGQGRRGQASRRLDYVSVIACLLLQRGRPANAGLFIPAVSQSADTTL